METVSGPVGARRQGAEPPDKSKKPRAVQPAPVAIGHRTIPRGGADYTQERPTGRPFSIPTMRLILDIGNFDGSAKISAVEGGTIAVVSESATSTDAGVLLACAEAVAGRPAGEQAARTATAALSDVYYAAIEAATPQQALREALFAANRAVRAGSERGRAAAVAALVLRGRRWISGHAGNVRVWRYRDLQVKQLTRDHVAPRALRRADVTRALGCSDSIDAEFHEGELREGDIYLVTSSGVHEALSGSALLGLLQSDYAAHQLAEALAQHALAARAPGYVGACVGRVEKLPPDMISARASTATLPIGNLPETGAEVDDYVIEKIMVKSRRFRLYKAKDRESGTTVALRFPDPAFPGAAQAFLREEWMSRRADSPFLLKPIGLRSGRRTALYSAVEYHHGQNLAKRILRKRGLPLPETVRLAEQLLTAIETLHGQGLIHGDIRANSVLYDKINRRLCILGLGIERNDVVAEDSRELGSSTLSYWAPELFAASPATERSDIYAAGVTVYRMLTAKYPYGRIRGSGNWKQPRDYVPVQQYKENLPSALDDVLQRACAVDPGRRYGTAAEFRAALRAVVDATAAPAAPPRAPGTDTTPATWSWWLAAGLVGGLLAYLYFTLR